MARADKGMGEKHGDQHVGPTSPDAFDQDDMANDIRGKNRLQGEDQGRVRNERQEQADVGGAGGAKRPRRSQR